MALVFMGTPYLKTIPVPTPKHHHPSQASISMQWINAAN
jgi:hypothetical protein